MARGAHRGTPPLFNTNCKSVGLTLSPRRTSAEASAVATDPVLILMSRYSSSWRRSGRTPFSMNFRWNAFGWSFAYARASIFRKVRPRCFAGGCFCCSQWAVGTGYTSSLGDFKNLATTLLACFGFCFLLFAQKIVTSCLSTWTGRQPMHRNGNQRSTVFERTKEPEKSQREHSQACHCV